VPYIPHYRAVIEGEFKGLGNTVRERWSTSYRVGTDGTFLSSPLNEDDYINNELTDFCNRLFKTPRFGTHVVVRKLSFNLIGANGKYANPVSHFKELPDSGATAITGQGSGGRLPLQCAVVATLRSHKARGPASHGRMFLPMPIVGITDDFVILDDHVVDLVALLKDAFDHTDGVMAGVTGTRFFPALVSPKGTGAIEEVVQVKVDNIVDTMRSRRAQLVPFVRQDTLSTW
jgi:hypothetical protein